MHRSWLRTKLAQSAGKATSKVSASARSLIPVQHDRVTDSCMMCGRTMRPHRLVRGDGRACSPICAKAWAEELP